MMIHETAKIINTKFLDIKAFRNVYIIDSVLGEQVSIGDDTTIERCKIDKNVTINRRSYLNDSEIGTFSYMGINTTINYTKMGKFCSIGRNVDIGGFDHDYKKITTMPQFRFEQLLEGGGELVHKSENIEKCVIGNDVWIAAGAIVLHKAQIGNGAVIGAGSVVTHDIPSYAIAVGCPARVIGHRCEEALIERLLELEWWNWPEEIIKANATWLIQSDITKQTVEKMEDIMNRSRY